MDTPPEQEKTATKIERSSFFLLIYIYIYMYVNSATHDATFAAHFVELVTQPGVGQLENTESGNENGNGKLGKVIRGLAIDCSVHTMFFSCPATISLSFGHFQENPLKSVATAFIVFCLFFFFGQTQVSDTQSGD